MGVVSKVVLPRRGFPRQRRAKDCVSAMFGLLDEASGEFEQSLEHKSCGMDSRNVWRKLLTYWFLQKVY
jgi:hypothetical protein